MNCLGWQWQELHVIRRAGFQEVIGPHYSCLIIVLPTNFEPLLWVGAYLVLQGKLTLGEVGLLLITATPPVQG